jgi:serine/threonine-protein kinase
VADVRERLQAALADRYEIEREIGEGGMATVFLALDRRHGRKVAIKVLKPELALVLGPERFEHEIAVAARLSHPSILPLFDSGDAGTGEIGEGNLLYYVMPYVEGDSLRERIASQIQLPIPEAVRIAKQVAAALGHAHAHGFVHRDIKPANILLMGDQAVVADFGIACAFGPRDSARLTSTGLTLGTPSYMSPEQVSSDAALDGRSDLYALGCVLFEMLIGEPPFGGPTAQVIMARHAVQPVPSLRAVRHTIPPELEHAVHTLLAKTPADRYQTAEEFIAALETPTTLPRTVALPARPSSVWRHRLRKALPLITAGLVVLLAATQLVPWLRRDVRGTAALDPNLVAILPFRLVGASTPATANLASGISELLYVRLPGDVGPRAVYPATVATALKRRGQDEASLGMKDALELARSLGAGRLLLGQIGSPEGQLVLSATLYGVPGGNEIARTRDITGPADSLLPMVDRLAAELLSRGAGESEQRLSDLVTTNLSALRAYLAGKQAFSRGRYTEAARQFNAALDIDSTFALAALGLTTTGAFVRTEGATRGKPLAWAARDKLGPRDRIFLTALLGPRYPAQSSEREHLDAWEDVVESQVDRVEPWHQLGEVLLHAGSWLGITGTRERAKAAFARALALDSTFAPSLAHTLDIAAQEGDTAAVRTLSARYFAIDSIGDLADFYRWRTAVALGDRKRLERIRARFPEMGPPALERIVGIAQLDGLGMADVLLAAEALLRTSVSSRDAQWAQVKLREVALNRGRPAEAARIVQESRDRSRNVEFYVLSDVVEALYWGADSATAAAVVRERSASADAPVPAGSPGTAPQYFDICSVNLWREAHGDLRTVPAAIAKLRRVPHPLDGFQTGYIAVCAAVLETRLAAAQHPKELPVLLDRLDSLAQTGPASTSWLIVAANLTVAELRERQGDLPRALAAARRRVSQYDLGEPRVLVGLSTFLREEGRLAALTGDTAGARRAYDHYLSLRDDPEPSVLPEVERVRAAVTGRAPARP